MTCAVTSRETPKVPTIGPVSSRRGSLVVETQASARSWKVSRSILATHRLAGLDHSLLVLDRPAEACSSLKKSKSDFPINLLERVQPCGLVGQEALADQEEAALQVLEEDALTGRGQQVAHAQALDVLAGQLTVFAPVHGALGHGYPPWYSRHID